MTQRKKAKRFKSHYDVARAWASREYEGGKSDHRVFFERDVIYSYGRHFPIARLLDTPTGGVAALYTSERYSVSTSKHKSIVASALCRADIPYVIVKNVDHFNPQGALDEMRECYYELLAEAVKSRKPDNLEWRLRRANEERSKALRFMSIMGISDVMPQARTIAEAQRIVKAREVITVCS